MPTTDRPDLVTRADAVRALYGGEVTVDRLIEHGDVVLALLTLADGRTAVDVARVDERGAARATRIS